MELYSEVGTGGAVFTTVRPVKSNRPPTTNEITSGGAIFSTIQPMTSHPPQRPNRGAFSSVCGQLASLVPCARPNTSAVRGNGGVKFADSSSDVDEDARDGCSSSSSSSKSSKPAGVKEQKPASVSSLCDEVHPCADVSFFLA